MLSFMIGWLVVGLVCGYFTKLEIDDENFKLIEQKVLRIKGMKMEEVGITKEIYGNITFIACVLAGYLAVIVYYAIKYELKIEKNIKN